MSNILDLNYELNFNDLELIDQCIICSSNDLIKISDVTLIDGITFFETSICKECGHVFRSLRPNEEWFFLNFNKRNEFQINADINPIQPEIEDDRNLRYNLIGKMLRNEFPSHRTLLDVGCGPGTGLVAFDQLGFSSIGIEPDLSRALYGQKLGLNIFAGDYKKFNSDDKFELITSIHSLEHFYNPALFLESISSFASDSCVLYVEVPEVLDHVKDWNDNLYLAHISNFNEISLRLVAEINDWHFLKRVFPYKNSFINANHLCMIFQKKLSKDFSKHNLVIKIDVKPIIYRYKFPFNHVKLPMHFFVPKINDLSLLYKSITEIKPNVHDNYDGRNINIVKNKFFVK